MIQHIQTTTALIVYADDKVLTFTKDNPKYTEALECLLADDVDGILALSDLKAVITQHFGSRITIEDGAMLFEGNPVEGSYLTDRIIEFAQLGLDADALVNFFLNLQENPSAKSKEELYLFLEHGNMPITDDGCFLAYKIVDSKYNAIHSNPDGTKNRHFIGDIVAMNRDEVDWNRENTCSVGLHFCSFGYLPHYAGNSQTDRIMIVKVNPKDVVSIPADYSNSKGRACSYEVVDEHTSGRDTHSLSGTVYSKADDSSTYIVTPPTKKKTTAKQKVLDKITTYIEGKLANGPVPLRNVQKILGTDIGYTIDKVKTAVISLGYRLKFTNGHHPSSAIIVG